MWTLKVTGIILICIIYLTIISQGFIFDKKYVGVGYSPYTMQWEGNVIPPWPLYTSSQVECQLKLISTKFTSLSTYNFGTSDSITTQIPRIAAKLNVQNNSLVLTIAQGIQGLQNDTLQLNELINAIKGAQEANSIYPGTVWALTFNWENASSVLEGQRILTMLGMTRNQYGLKVGARMQNCETILYPDKYPGIVDTIRAIVEQSDYIMCNLYPDYISTTTSVEAAVNNVAQFYILFSSKAKIVNPNIEVIIGETGWPSKGIAFNGGTTSVVNLINFYQIISQLASDNKVKIQMFEAIDEPWKSNQNNRDPTSPEGFNGGEGYYGWWYQPDNQNPCQFIEKISLINK